MNKGIKSALIFTGGAVVGIGICGAKVIGYALNDDDIRGVIVKKISGRIDKVLYGAEGRRYRPGRSTVSYRDYYSRSYNRNSFYDEFDTVIFETVKEAVDTIEQMEKTIDEYGFVTVADMYDLVGLSPSYRANRYGWTNLREASPKKVQSGGYYIDLPRAMPIDY